MKKLIGLSVAALTVALVAPTASAGWCKPKTPETGTDNDSACPYTATFVGSNYQGGGSHDAGVYRSTNSDGNYVQYTDSGQYESVSIQGYSSSSSTFDYSAAETHRYSGGVGVSNSNDDVVRTYNYSSNNSSYSNTNTPEDYIGRSDRYWSGGDRKRDYYYEDSHTIDNENSIDGVLLSFDHDVTLLDIELGYVTNDWDITLWEFTGDADDFSTAALSDESSWNMFNFDSSESTWTGSSYNYGLDGENGELGDNIGLGNSSYYLLTALNPAADGADSKHDYFKLLSITYCEHPEDEPPSEVSAPATLGLLLAGLPLLMRRFRRK